MASGAFGKVRFVHTADWHLGARTYRVTDRAGIPVQFGWVRDAALQLSSFVQKRGVELVLMCGDILATPNPPPTAENILAGILRQITDAGAKVIYLLGNHELPGWGDHPAKIYETLAVPGIIVADEPKLHKIELASGTVQVATIPYQALRERDFDELAAKLGEMVDPSMPSILMAHVFVVGARLSGSDVRLLPDEPYTSPETLLNLPFTYIALGHIHKSQAVCTAPPAVYAGSIQRLDFSEEGEQKGFVYGELVPSGDGFSASWEFVPTDAVDFVTIDVDTRGKGDPTSAVISAIKRRRFDGAVVRIRVRRTASDPKLATTLIHRAAAGQGARLVRIQTFTDTPRTDGSKAAASPSGNIEADLERYIREKRPELKQKIRQIIRKVKELDESP